eukprot:TRINITY_DN11912_c0_g1_i1.p1 TRINITY_DN11912_c0_g1~~TRINITY_DN11912_c0_g1_i1.p1  ORF type:complete len:136 (-),score=16.38 TRINITY_DN11912_c0_g1_i1:313-720(-)
MGVTKATELLKKLDITPDCAPSSTLIRGLCNVLPKFSHEADELPKDCFVVCSQNTEAFHTSLACHPATYPFINVNQALQSYLNILPNYNDKCSKAVLERVKTKKFQSKEELGLFIETKFPKMVLTKIEWHRMEFF